MVGNMVGHGLELVIAVCNNGSGVLSDVRVSYLSTI
jgi:hypothetical protein